MEIRGFGLETLNSLLFLASETFYFIQAQN